MIKPKKKIITVTTESLCPYELESTLADAKSKIEKLIEQYGPNARLDWDSRYYEPYAPEPSPRYHVQIQREENDEEFAKRIALETKYRTEQEARDLAEFTRLQQKFGAKK